MTAPRSGPPSAPAYAELQVTSHFSFLRGASAPDELFNRAAALGITALGITDRNSLAGMVRAHEAARTSGVRLVVGCRLDLAEGPSVLVYPTDRTAYARLCRLLTLGKGRAGKGKCHLGWDDLAAYAAGLIAVLVPDTDSERGPEDEAAACAADLRRLREIFGANTHLALTLRRRPNDRLRLHHLAALAARVGAGGVVTNDVLFHDPERRLLHDVMSCIRHRITIDDLGTRRTRHADRYLKSPAEMHRLFAAHPDALARGMAIADQCRFSLDELAYQYPDERDDPTRTPQQTLVALTWAGAARRYPNGVPAPVQATLRHELGLIETLGYAPYFLTVHAIVRFARSRGILCQGRGSAANSAVCYVLGITSIDPERHDLLFERFVSVERREPPDIDVDFEHERRESVIQWIYDTYGRTRAALCAVVIRYRTRAALRDVGKALGLPEDVLRDLAREIRHRPAADGRWVALGPAVIGQDRRLRLALTLAEALTGMPRHLSQHPGGFVLTQTRLDDLVPIEPASMAGRQVIEWDKDDIAALRFMKVDILALGMLSCLKRGLDLLAAHKGVALDLATIPAEDPQTYAMIRMADTLGTFQIESRAQMSMLPRLKPRTFYDLVVQVAIVRPGPIQGDMVHPYLRRREGREPVDYPTPALEQVLGKTLGVPLFQEQAMRVAIVCAGFTPGEADLLRKSMATFKHTGGVSRFKDKLIAGMVANGYTRPFAEQTFRQLEGFGAYGFPESHAASFALIAYASAWLKCWHPDVFCAALLNAQPMGFYAPAQIVRDAVAHGVDVRPVCVNASRWDCTLESDPAPAGALPVRCAVRLGLRMVRGLANAQAASLIAARADHPFSGVDDLWRRAGVPGATLVQLAEADAFRPAFGLDRRAALWAIKGLTAPPLPLFAACADGGNPAAGREPSVTLPPMSEGGEVVADYHHVGLSLRCHPLALLRPALRRSGMVACADAMAARDGMWLDAAGLVLVRQRPGSAKGVMFVTLEDETGIANLVVWPRLYEQIRPILLLARLLAARGRIQREGEVVHLIVHSVRDLTRDLAGLDPTLTP